MSCAVFSSARNSDSLSPEFASKRPRIGFFGYKVQHLKTIVFSLAGSIAGLAGGLYAFHEGFVWPNMLGVILSTQVVLYTLFGGVGTLIGAVIGVVGIEVLSFVLADNYQEIWPIILGVLLLPSSCSVRPG